MSGASCGAPCPRVTRRRTPARRPAQHRVQDVVVAIVGSGCFDVDDLLLPLGGAYQDIRLAAHLAAGTHCLGLRVGVPTL